MHLWIFWPFCVILLWLRGEWRSIGRGGQGRRQPGPEPWIVNTVSAVTRVQSPEPGVKPALRTENRDQILIRAAAAVRPGTARSQGCPIQLLSPAQINTLWKSAAKTLVRKQTRGQSTRKTNILLAPHVIQKPVNHPILSYKNVMNKWPSSLLEFYKKVRLSCQVPHLSKTPKNILSHDTKKIQRISRLNDLMLMTFHDFW